MTETTGRGKQFLKSVGIYAVGNIGSKLITFLMIPLYTFFVETAEFGYYDLCLTAVMLLTSFASLQLRDGAFRFLIDSKTDEEKTEVVSATMRLLSRSLLVFMLLSAIVSFVYPIRCLWLSFGLLVSMALIEVFGQMARGVCCQQHNLGIFHRRAQRGVCSVVRMGDNGNLPCQYFCASYSRCVY